MKYRCILVDDEEDVRARLETLLKSTGSVEIVASTGDPEKATRLIPQYQPDLVFLDVEMPRLNGFEVIRNVRASGSNPTIIMVTAHNQYAIKAIKNAAFDFILKPFDLEELTDVICRFSKTHNHVPDCSKINGYTKLSIREKEIVALLLEGLTSKQIGEKLFISKHTVNKHRRNILEKLNLPSTISLLRLS